MRTEEEQAPFFPRALEQRIYSLICSCDGITAREIAERLGADRHAVNTELYRSALMRELCYRDDQFRWYGLIRQTVPHEGLYDYCGWYGTAEEFLRLDEEKFLKELLEGCARVGRSLNDHRGLLHSFRDCREQMLFLFRDLEQMGGGLPWRGWELAFEMRLNRARYIRVYADVLLITRDRVFSFEFKMKDRVLPEEAAQALKYRPYLQVLFGPGYRVIPALVLTRAHDLFEKVPTGSGEALRIVSGDMLFNVPDDVMHFLP